MNPIPLTTLILQGIPEEIAVTALAFCIANIPLKWGKIILIGVFLALSAYILRKFSIAPGMHSVVLFITQFLFLIILTKANIFMSFLGSILSFITLIIFETGSVAILMKLTGITPDILMSSDSIARTLVFEPQVILLFLTAFLVKKYRYKFFKEEAYESY